MRHMKLHILQVYSPKFIRHITRYKEFTKIICAQKGRFAVLFVMPLFQSLALQ